MRSLRIFCITALLSIAGSPIAHAVPQFWEAGGGLGQGVGSAGWDGNPDGFSLNYFFSYGMRLNSRGLPSYLGLRLTGISQSTDNGSATVHSPHLYFQFHLWRLAVGLGVAPVFQTTSIVSGTYSGLGLASWDFPITPEVSFALTAQLQVISGSSLSTNASGVASFRFFFGVAGTSDGNSDYRGYRYPFGGSLK